MAGDEEKNPDQSFETEQVMPTDSPPAQAKKHNRRVRFPENNDTKARRSYFTNDSADLPGVQDEYPNQEEDYFSRPPTDGQYSDSETDAYSPGIRLTRPDETIIDLVDSQRSSISSSSDPRRQLLSSARRQYPEINDIPGMLDSAGDMFSGGMAPGAQSQGRQYIADTEDDPEADLTRRRETLLRALREAAAASASEPPSCAASPHDTPAMRPATDTNNTRSEDGIPMVDLNEKNDDGATVIHDMDAEAIAKRLVRSHTIINDPSHRERDLLEKEESPRADFRSPAPVLDDFDEQTAEGHDIPQHEDYIPQGQVQNGVLSSLLRLYADQDADAQSTKSSSSTLIPSTPPVDDPFSSYPPSGSVTPDEKSGKREKWYKHKKNHSSYSLGTMVANTTRTLAAPGTALPKRPKFHKRHSANAILKRKRKKEEFHRITVHIADVLQRQRFLLRICRALMLYGAPTHRLEEYMKMTSRALEINGQYLYIPGCMLVSFDDAMTHTSEMRLVRCAQGLNLTKLHETHQIYKEVIHDVIGVEEASKRIDELIASKNAYPAWACVIFWALASAFVGPWSWGGTWKDLPLSGLLGGSVGILQILVAPKSDLYNNVFEITSSIAVSFIARAFGSIYHHGYMILCGSLELQSKNIVSGSVRMFYAIIYSLFLGFGITMGSVIYGWCDKNAVSQTTCEQNLSPWWYLLLIPLFTVFIAQVNQASLRQIPIMVFICGAGYAVTFFTRKHLAGSSEFVSAIGAFVIGVCGNLYSRIGHGLAFAAMLPAIFAQVPNSVASQGSLVVAGIQNANMIASNHTTKPTVTTLPNGVVMTMTPTPTPSASTLSSGSVLNLGMMMVQVCIGITVGLFVATLCIYPFGKKRSGLFTF